MHNSLRACSCARHDGSSVPNRVQLKLALLDLLELKGAVKPKRVRFFRGQMQTIIGRALADLDIKPVPSRRCFTLMGASFSHAAASQSLHAQGFTSGSSHHAVI